jgi:hypothetical protein
MRRFCKHETVWHSVTIYIQNIIVEHIYLVSYYVTRITILACYFHQKCSKYSPLLCFPYSGTATPTKSLCAYLVLSQESMLAMSIHVTFCVLNEAMQTIPTRVYGEGGVLSNTGYLWVNLAHVFTAHIFCFLPLRVKPKVRC